MRTLLTSVFVAAFTLAALACQGPAGPQGATGDPGPPGAAADPEMVDETMVASLVERMLGDSQAAPAPGRANASEYTRHLVREAIDRYESDGIDSTAAYYNTQR